VGHRVRSPITHDKMGWALCALRRLKRLCQQVTPPPAERPVPSWRA